MTRWAATELYDGKFYSSGRDIRLRRVGYIRSDGVIGDVPGAFICKMADHLTSEYIDKVVAILNAAVARGELP